MPKQKILLTILGMSLVTYLPRMLPLVVLSRIKLPSVFIRWLRYIPPAVLSALLLPGILLSEGRINLTVDNHALIASIPCLIAALIWKNLFVTVVVGVVAMLILNLL